MFIDQIRGNSIASLSPDGTIREYLVPTPNSGPTYGVTGPDGAQWFTEFDSGKIGRLDPSTGTITEFPVPGNAGAGPWWIVTGPDGAMWFTEYHANMIGRITTSGTITQFATPTPNSGPNGLTVGWDGALYFVEETANSIGRLTTEGVFTEFPLPFANSDPLDITTGSDGNGWFTEHSGNKIGRITINGVIAEFPVPSGSGASTIAPGPDGALWFTEDDAGNLARITTSGTITEYRTLTPGGGPIGVSAGPNGTVSYTELKAAKVGTVTACGLGLVATYSGGTLSTGFEMGVTTSAQWTIQLVTATGSKTLLSRQLSAVVPVRPFTLQFNVGTLVGTAQVVSTLNNAAGNLICGETQMLAAH